jgi:hypothetical protein
MDMRLDRRVMQLDLFAPAPPEPLRIQVMSIDGRVLDEYVITSDREWREFDAWSYLATLEDRQQRRYVHLHHSCRPYCSHWTDWQDAALRPRA